MFVHFVVRHMKTIYYHYGACWFEGQMSREISGQRLR